MWFVGLGVLLLVLKLLAIGPVAGWAWWWVLSPFAGALVWWAWADASGYTKRREMDKMEDRKEARRQKAMQALGQIDKDGKRR
ncbi:TIGR04438 family Trp-rich protein [Pelomonas sp. KK5]|uniref:TIGR04438 family Trp-rich protein n=1 Tax=Pelomonas sp. KK5 TaxID=1855730 RepID=UPI00097C1D45|nr:TIGR04438 family Trp-rich protein [Pelomonas sp. KK5]